MGNLQLTPPTLGGGFPKPNISLGDFQLTLKPEVQAAINQLKAGGGASPLLTTAWITPEWSQLFSPLPSPSPPPFPMKPPFMQAGPTAPPKPPLFTPGAGPETPRLATVGDLGKALWGVPAIRLTAERQLKMVTTAFLAQPNAVKAVEITAGATFLLSGFMMPVKAPFTVIQGQSVPIPPVPGLSFSFDYTNRGVGLTWDSIAGSPLSAQASGALGPSPNGAITVTLDVAKWIPAFR